MKPVIIVGAGAAGLATAILTRRLAPSRPVLLLDGARTPGAKILVSGGSRCNVTNVRVTEHDFWGGRRTIVRRVLRAFSVADTVAFFSQIGVPLHEEAGGKLFPDSNRSRDVLEALLREAAVRGVDLRADHRVHGIARVEGGVFEVDTPRGPFEADAIVLATGGLSLPKSGSDGAGLEIARALGHTIVPTTPALAPLILDGVLHRELSGVSADAELSVWRDGRVAERLTGALLWTHFGVSGPVVLNASRHWLRAKLEGIPVRVTASFCPGTPFDEVDARLARAARDRPRAAIQTMVAEIVPAAMATAVLQTAAVDASTPLAQLPRDARRRVVHALVEWELPIIGSRGYAFAEATAGGVSLDEIEPATMASRICPGLFLVGEMLDVDGRIGGFNFQWAWSSAFVAARGMAKLPQA